MPSRTRMNPTANGPLHLGHAYISLVNQAEAHRTGGPFLLRIEDDQDYWVWRNGGVEPTKRFCNAIVEDLAWLDIEPDIVYLQSERHELIESARHMFLDGKWFDTESKFVFMAPAVHGVYDTVFYPYAPRLTLDKVILDALDAINVLIRGIDLLSENAFYEFCCDLLGIIPPHMFYMPRMVTQHGGQLSPLSKTEGGFSIASYREQGYRPDDLMQLLRQSCLVDPAGEWLISNVKDKPVWIG